MPVPPYKMRARSGGRAQRGLSSTERLLDDGFRLRVEEMDAIGHEGQPDLLVRLRLDGGLDASDDLLVRRLGVEQDLCAERLDDLDHGVEGKIRRVRAHPDAQVLRTDTERDRLALVGHQALRLLGWHLDLDAAGLGEERAA